MKNYKKTALAVMGMSAVLFAGNAMAAIQIVEGTNVFYSFDDASLFGTATASGDSLVFAPANFTAVSTTGLPALTPALLYVTVTAKTNYQLTAFSLAESGGYTRSSGTSVGATGTFTALDDFEGMNNTDAKNFVTTSLNATSGAWNTAANLAVPVAGWGDNGVVSTIKLTISNQLFVTGGVGEIWKNAVTVNTSVSPVPEAETYAMMLAGLGLIGFMARRTRIAV
ncbi:MAG: FxDxF family PEP-CTERM protein [Thiobacillus sp.]|nr:FxDxF family PEP-CTERM protein [Thiobacillus sp.]